MRPRRAQRRSKKNAKQSVQPRETRLKIDCWILQIAAGKPCTILEREDTVEVRGARSRHVAIVTATAEAGHPTGRAEEDSTDDDIVPETETSQEIDAISGRDLVNAIFRPGGTRATTTGALRRATTITTIGGLVPTTRHPRRSVHSTISNRGRTRCRATSRRLVPDPF